MGVRLVLFATAFNLLLWLSRLTVGLWLGARMGVSIGVATSFIAPSALLLLATRVLPTRREALLAVASLSALTAMLTAG